MPANKIVPLVSRYKSVKTEFRQLSKYLGYLISDGNYVRCEYDAKSKKVTAVDFEGGPMLGIGSIINLSSRTHRKIKSIRPVYLVELE